MSNYYSFELEMELDAVIKCLSYIEYDSIDRLLRYLLIYQ